MLLERLSRAAGGAFFLEGLLCGGFDAFAEAGVDVVDQREVVYGRAELERDCEAADDVARAA